MSASDSPSHPLRWSDYALALLPIALAFTGALGIAVGPAACALNLFIMRGPERRGTKKIAATGIAMLAALTWVAATHFVL